MTAVEQRFPPGPPIEVGELLAAAAAEPAGGRLRFGDRRVRDFLARAARGLLAPELSRRHPELASLGFFLRPAEVDRAVAELADPPGGLRLPRGLVFHVPPANVDTVFVYSWALSALAGNANVVRLSPRGGAAAAAVLDVLAAALAGADPAVAQTQRVVTYDRDEEVTAALSAACDLRVIWGGDRAVSALRRVELSPAARDLTFPDRSSFTVLSVPGWTAAPAERRERCVEAFRADAYWFDQAACASPRTVYWIGERAAAERCAEEFWALLAAAVAARGPEVDAAMAVEKRVGTYGLAATGAASRLRFHGNAVALADLARPELAPRHWLGAGTFAVAVLPALADVVPLVRPRDQTVTHFGFPAGELAAFAGAVGPGVDRIVPVGEALSFDRRWDGYELLREFSRIRVVR
jgi:hypothetical protein